MPDDWRYALGPLRLSPDSRTLRAGDVAVEMRSRAFDLLVLLVENRDRVVGRDEILAHVWAGSTVSDGNIAVQVAALRRVLEMQGNSAKAIANLPGRGYRYVGEVVERCAPAPSPDAMAPAAGPRTRWPILAAAACVVLVLTGAAARYVLSSRELRLTIGVQPFAASGPGAADLALAYRTELLSLPSRYADIRTFPVETSSGCRPYHFCLSGMVQVTPTSQRLTYGLTRADGEKLPHKGDGLDVPLHPTSQEVLHGASLVYAAVARPVIRAERAAQSGRPHDPLGWLIRAKTDCHHDSEPACYTRALGDDEQALVGDPNFFPALLFKSALLVQRLPLTPAQAGDADAETARRITTDLLSEASDDLVVMETEAIALIELGGADQLERAEALLQRGLAIDPANADLPETLLGAQDEAGDTGAADRLLAADPDLAGTEEAAELHFIEKKYPAALADLATCLAQNQPPTHAALMTLLKVTTQIEAGELSGAPATAAIRGAVAPLPAAFHTQAGLRRIAYEMPPVAWERFKAALTSGGMPP